LSCTEALFWASAKSLRLGSCSRQFQRPFRVNRHALCRGSIAALSEARRSKRGVFTGEVQGSIACAPTISGTGRPHRNRRPARPRIRSCRPSRSPSQPRNWARTGHFRGPSLRTQARSTKTTSIVGQTSSGFSFVRYVLQSEIRPPTPRSEATVCAVTTGDISELIATGVVARHQMHCCHFERADMMAKSVRRRECPSNYCSWSFAWSLIRIIA
jgi:hypothetical protein